VVTHTEFKLRIQVSVTSVSSRVTGGSNSQGQHITAQVCQILRLITNATNGHV